MRVLGWFLIVGIAHAGVTFAAYATHMFGLSGLIDGLVLTLAWLFLPTSLAFSANLFASRGLFRVAGRVLISAAASLLSLFIGAFFAVNTYGT